MPRRNIVARTWPNDYNMSQHVAAGWPNARNMLRPTMLGYVALNVAIVRSRDAQCFALRILTAHNLWRH